MTLILVGCGKGNPPVTRSTDSSFDKYINILADHGVYTDTPIFFSDREDGVAGTCTKWSNGYREIAIDPTYWNETLKHHDSYRLELLAHEIGHCDYNLKHNNSTDDFNSPCSADSVMYKANFGGECFYKDEVINEYYLEIFYE